jgi:hypothetical protein
MALVAPWGKFTWRHQCSDAHIVDSELFELSFVRIPTRGPKLDGERFNIICKLHSVSRRPRHFMMTGQCHWDMMCTPCATFKNTHAVIGVLPPPEHSFFVISELKLCFLRKRGCAVGSNSMGVKKKCETYLTNPGPLN